MIYLTVALVLLWLLVGGYLVFMLIRQRSLERELSTLEEELQDRISSDQT